MDLVDLIAEKKFIGQDFLTWLWWKSEEDGQVITPEIGAVGVAFNGTMRLESPSENMTCKGESSDLPEARAGLLAGKKPEQAYVMVEHNGEQFGAVFVASLFELKGIVLPRVAVVEDVDGEEGMVLERIFLHVKLVEIFTELLKSFAVGRATGDWAKVQRWATSAAV